MRVEFFKSQVILKSSILVVGSLCITLGDVGLTISITSFFISLSLIKECSLLKIQNP